MRAHARHAPTERLRDPKRKGVADRDARRMRAVIGILQIAWLGGACVGLQSEKLPAGLVPLRAGGHDLLVSRTRSQRQRRTEPRCHAAVSISGTLGVLSMGGKRSPTPHHDRSEFGFFVFFVSSVETLAPARPVPVPMFQCSNVPRPFPQFRHIYLFITVRRKLETRIRSGDEHRLGWEVPSLSLRT